MKFTITLLVTIAALIIAVSAVAQNGFDYFNIPRVQVISEPQLLAGASTVSTPIDTHGYLGVANILLTAITNSAPGTITATIEGSADTNTWAAISYAKAVSTSVIYTNSGLGYGTNVYFTDTYLLPGTYTTPTAATAGWASGYIAPAPFTNTGVVTLTSAKIAMIGYQIADAPRYLRVTWTATGGATTNCFVSAVLTGRRGGEVK